MLVLQVHVVTSIGGVKIVSVYDMFSCFGLLLKHLISLIVSLLQELVKVEASKLGLTASAWLEFHSLHNPVIKNWWLWTDLIDLQTFDVRLWITLPAFTVRFFCLFFIFLPNAMHLIALHLLVPELFNWRWYHWLMVSGWFRNRSWLIGIIII